jgi:hypothetical protein
MAASKNELEVISRADATQYDALWPLLSAMRDEYSELSKKKPDGTLNKLKVHGVNRLLTDLKELLKNETVTRYLDLLSDDDLPQYSDVTIILSQYVAAMKSFRQAREHKDSSYKMVWRMSK